MAKSPKSKKQKDEIELRPNGWSQFERAVDAAVKIGPLHRVAPKPKGKRTAGQGRARVGKAKN